ncbi:MAG: hypothetical protein KIC92_09100 [Clostridiales bacterium]|nr:hypothetical protein [Clostridiales bacterium]
MIILDEILNILKFLGYKIYPFGTDKIENCVIYNLIPISSNRVIEQSRLEITVICLDIGIGLQMIENIKKVLITLGDNGLNNNILSIELNGGGSLENVETSTFHFKAFFNIKSKY